MHVLDVGAQPFLGTAVTALATDAVAQLEFLAALFFGNIVGVTVQAQGFGMWGADSKFLRDQFRILVQQRLVSLGMPVFARPGDKFIVQNFRVGELPHRAVTGAAGAGGDSVVNVTVVLWQWC